MTTRVVMVRVVAVCRETGGDHVGLKDVVDWVAGRKQNKQRGSRRSPESKRHRDESTVQIPSPISGRASSPPLSATTPAPHAPPATPGAAAHVPPVNGPPVSGPPANPPSSPPSTAAHVAPSGPPAQPPRTAAPARARADSAEATQYVSVPKIGQGKLVGVLVGIGGALEGEIHKIVDRDMKVGRAETSDVKLLDPKISREHAKIVAVDGDLMIVPMTDKNPVYVNDHVVEEAEQLSDGDKLQLGNPGASVFRFRTIEGQ